jgi:hypothetical protein
MGLWIADHWFQLAVVLAMVVIIFQIFFLHIHVQTTKENIGYSERQLSTRLIDIHNELANGLLQIASAVSDQGSVIDWELNEHEKKHDEIIEELKKIQRTIIVYRE